MDLFDYVINKKAFRKANPHRLSSYRQAAEIICSCWNRLDMSIIEPYLDKDVVWSGGAPHKVINGKEDYLELMQEVFDSLQYSKKNYRAEVINIKSRFYACITVDDVREDLMHRLEIEDGIIKKIEITPSPKCIEKQFSPMPWGVIGQTTLKELAAAVTVMEQCIKLAFGNTPITWATVSELKNSHCQLSFTCDGLSYDVLIEKHSWSHGECRYVMYYEYDNLVAKCSENDHIPCVLALDEYLNFSSLALMEDMDTRIRKLRSEGKKELPFRKLFQKKV